MAPPRTASRMPATAAHPAERIGELARAERDLRVLAGGATPGELLGAVWSHTPVMAKAAGFRGASHFAAAFRQRVGTSPGEWRALPLPLSGSGRAQFAGSRGGAPLSFTMKTKNLAGFESLAFVETLWMSSGDS